MNKEQILNKIIGDLPIAELRGEMSKQEWYGWFEEAFDKGYLEATKQHEDMSVLAVEFGYKQCEKGNNIEAAIANIKFNNQ